MREIRDQHDSDHPSDRPSDRPYEPERLYETPYFHDDRVTSRGFGIRTETTDDLDDRRDRRQEPKKRSDEELPRESDYDRDDRRRSRLESKDGRRERRESKRGSDDDEKERTRFRDKVATGLGIAATAVGLVPAIKDKDDDKREKESSRRKGSDDERERERRRDSTARERPRASERSRSRHRDYDRDTKETSRRNTDPRKSGEAVISSSDSDESKKPPRRHRNSGAFNPNDTSELKQLKDQLAALKTSDKEKEKDTPAVIETRNRSSSPTKDTKTITEAISTKDLRRFSPDSKPTSSLGEESRGRDSQPTPPEEKQVRVVSPPRDKKDDKPLKGILKQPKVSFPEEPNPIREGVAPHKEDKKARDAPPGAKWTKISRKVVNPEALTIGKERFEVRDDFVIVLRVLSKEEIQAYASATQVLRGESNQPLRYNPSCLDVLTRQQNDDAVRKTASLTGIVTETTMTGASTIAIAVTEMRMSQTGTTRTGIANDADAIEMMMNTTLDRGTWTITTTTTDPTETARLSLRPKIGTSKRLLLLFSRTLTFSARHDVSSVA
ncbi:hypothetical protein FDECE_9976 [Fusarium decemcellulare]|nr:hypothetical protein FDECE_9976 [Fusarium decemcellulare]